MTQQEPKLNCNKRKNINGIKGIPRASCSGDQADCTIESHRSPTIDHPTKTGNQKQVNLICRNKKEESHKMGRQRNDPQPKENKESPEGMSNEIKASNL